MTNVPPLIEVAIAPKEKADAEKLARALARLVDADASFFVSADTESGQTVINGASERHLDAVIDILKQKYGIEVDIGAPQVAYRERPPQRVEIDYTHKKQTGGSGQFARVKLAVAPNETGKGYAFESTIADGNVLRQHVSGIEKGLKDALGNGVVAGFPVVDVKVQLIDGTCHEADSSALAFENAARAAFREALLKSRPVLLEPTMRVEITTPPDHAGRIVSDMKSRRGEIIEQHVAMRKGGKVASIRALAPLANMFGYDNTLKSISGGRASYEMAFSHYEPVPGPDDPGPFRPAMAMRA